MLKAISLYTGIGGLDFGFEVAGFRTAVAVEMDRVCCETLALNVKWPILPDDIHEFKSPQILRKGGLRKGEPDILIGGPPCQPFSKSGWWSSGDSGRLDDPRSDTLAQYLRVLRDTKPRAFFLENVRGMAFKGKNEGVEFIREGVAEVNRQAGTQYEVNFGVLNAAHFGVPQFRERVFLIGSRDGRPFEFPKPTHGSEDVEDLFNTDLEPFMTAWDAIGDLPAVPQDPSLYVRGKWGDLLPTIPEGDNYLYHTPRGRGYPLFGWRMRYWNFLLKLAKARPSWTLQAQPGTATGPFHWKNRRLTAQELARLQTFRGGLKFKCGRTDIQKMAGNAVPSLLAEVLAREIRRQLFDFPPRGKLKLLPKRQDYIPPPEKYGRKLPPQYLSMIGEHPDHPGEGKGPLYQKASGELPLV